MKERTSFLSNPFIVTLAFLSSVLIIINWSILPIIIFFVFLFTFWKYKINFLIFSICALFPIIASFGPINELPIIFVLSPPLFVMTVFLAIKNNEKIFSRNIALFITGLGIIFVWAAIGYIRDPISISLNNKIIIKEYFYIITGIFIFFINLFYFKEYRINEKRFLCFLALSSLILSILRILSYFGDFYIPFFGSAFNYIEEGAQIWRHRLGGIDQACIIGIPAVLAYYYRTRLKYVFLACFFIVAVIGGGKTIFFSFILLLLVDLFLTERKKIILIFIFLLLIIAFFIYFSDYIRLPEQLNSILRINNLYREDPLRLATYQYYWLIFAQNPIFGKGIGFYGGIVQLEYSKFIDEQLISGGHGAYLSILSTFGIGGGFFLLIMLLGGMLKSFSLFKELILRRNNLIYLDRMVIFIFYYLVLTIFSFLTVGSGFDNLPLYYFIGMLSRILLRKSQLADNIKP